MIADNRTSQAVEEWLRCIEGASPHDTGIEYKGALAIAEKYKRMEEALQKAFEFHVMPQEAYCECQRCSIIREALSFDPLSQQ